MINIETVIMSWIIKTLAAICDDTSTVCYNNDTLYCNNRPIAKHIRYSNRNFVFITTNYNNSEIISMVENACSKMVVFHVKNVDIISPLTQFIDYRERYMLLISKYAKHTYISPDNIALLNILVNESNTFSDVFGLKIRLVMPDDLDNFIFRCQEIELRERERKQRILDNYNQRIIEGVQRWQRGETDFYPPYNYTSLRIIGNKVETSFSIKISIVNFIRSFRELVIFYNSGKVYDKNINPILVGPYIIDSIDTDKTVFIQCHKMLKNEIFRIAGLLRLTTPAINS